MDESEDRWRKEEIRFIDIEIDTAITFIEIALSEFRAAPNSQRCRELVSFAVRAYEQAVQFIGRVSDLDEQQRLLNKFQTFNEGYRRLERRMHPPEDE